MCLGDRVSDQHRRADGVSDGRGGAGTSQPKWSGPGERDEVRNRLLEPLDVDGGEDHDLRLFLLRGAAEIRQGGVGATFGETNIATRIVYAVVGLSALYQAVQLPAAQRRWTSRTAAGHA